MSPHSRQGHPPSLPYTLGLLMPPAGKWLIRFWQRRICKYCLDMDRPAIAHLTLKYLGYRNHPDDDAAMVALIPEIAAIVRPYLPIPIDTKGLDLFWTDPEQDPVVFLKILDHRLLRTIHLELLHHLGPRIRLFPRADDVNYHPHITLSKRVKKQAVPNLLELMHFMRREPRRRIWLEELVLMTPERVHVVARANDRVANDRVASDRICP